MNFIVKKTTELNPEETQGIVDLFNEVFEKKRTLEEFSNQFINNIFGFSYHSFVVDDGVIVGAHSSIPCYYTLNGVQMLCVNYVDTMIKKTHRGIETFYDLIKSNYQYCEDEGVKFVLGFPNDNSYPIFKATKLLYDIGKLNTYCLPFRVGGVRKQFAFLNPLSSLFCWCWQSVSFLFANSKVANFPIHKEHLSYNATRYKRSNGEYRKVNLKGLEFFYKILLHDGVRTAFLIDVSEKSAKNFCRAVRYIIKIEKNNFDLLLYIGNLPFSCTGMIKIPRKFEPKNFNFAGISLEKKQLDKEFIFNIDNWDVNLSNYDLI